jgi:hypothetical protein
MVILCSTVAPRIIALDSEKVSRCTGKDLQISEKGLEQGLKWPRSIFFNYILTLEDETAMLVKMLGISHPVTGLKSNKLGDHKCTVAKA